MVTPLPLIVTLRSIPSPMTRTAHHPTAVMLIVPVTLTLMTLSQAESALISCTAARRVQTAPDVAQTPSPGAASAASPKSLTVKVGVLPQEPMVIV